MNRNSSVVIWFVALLFLIASCSGDNTSEVPAATDTPTHDTTVEELTIFVPAGGILIFSGIEMFASELPYNINLMEGMATDVVIEGLYNRTLDLVFLYRRPKPDEEIAFFELVQTNVVIVTHEDVGVDNLTSEEITDIFSGEITNWSQVGGQNQEIILFVLPEFDSITEALRAGALGERPFSESVHIFSNETDVMLSAISIPGGIGYASITIKKYLEMIDSNKEDSDFNIVSINGITIEDPAYPISIVFGFGYLPEQEDFLQPLFDWIIELWKTPQGKQLLALFGIRPAGGE
jgi:phosphate transport system substrate-binding protein